MNPLEIFLSLVLVVLAFVLGKSSLREVPNLFEGIEKAKKRDRQGVEDFVNGITHTDKLEVAYKEFGGARNWIYFWGGELSAALIYILALLSSRSAATFGFFYIFFLSVRSVGLYKSIPDSSFPKSIFLNFLYYTVRLVYYWLALWAVVYFGAQIAGETIQFNRTLSDNLLSLSAQSSFTLAVGLLIVIALRGYFEKLHGHKKEILDAIGEKIVSGELDLLKDEKNFFQNTANLEKKMSEEIKGYFYFEREIDSIKRVIDYIFYYALFGIYFLISSEEEFSSQFLPDKLMFGLFLFFILISILDVKTLLRNWLTETPT